MRGWVVFIDAVRHLCPGLTNFRFVEVSRCRLSGLIYSTFVESGLADFAVDQWALFSPCDAD